MCRKQFYPPPWYRRAWLTNFCIACQTQWAWQVLCVCCCRLHVQVLWGEQEFCGVVFEVFVGFVGCGWLFFFNACLFVLVQVKIFFSETEKNNFGWVSSSLVVERTWTLCKTPLCACRCAAIHCEVATNIWMCILTGPTFDIVQSCSKMELLN